MTGSDNNALLNKITSMASQTTADATGATSSSACKSGQYIHSEKQSDVVDVGSKAQTPRYEGVASKAKSTHGDSPPRADITIVNNNNNNDNNNSNVNASADAPKTSAHPCQPNELHLAPPGSGIQSEIAILETAAAAKARASREKAAAPAFMHKQRQPIEQQSTPGNASPSVTWKQDAKSVAASSRPGPRSQADDDLMSFATNPLSTAFEQCAVTSRVPYIIVVGHARALALCTKAGFGLNKQLARGGILEVDLDETGMLHRVPSSDLRLDGKWAWQEP